jgi:hypothetical protein
LATVNAADDNVFSPEEKLAVIIPNVAELDARYTQVRARAVALGISVTSLDANRTALLDYLGSLTPPYRDNTQPTTLSVPLFDDYPTSFTASDAVRGTDAAYFTSNDNTANFGNEQRVFTCTSSASYIAAMRVKKDAVAASTRAVMVRIVNANGTARLAEVKIETSTGSSNLNGTVGGGHQGSVYVLNDLEFLLWVLWVAPSDCTQGAIQIFPAIGTNLVAGDYNAATQGQVSFKDLCVVQTGNFSSIGRLAFEFFLRTYAATIDAVAKSISETDGTTGLEIVGPLRVDIAGNSDGTVKSGQLTKTVNFAAKVGIGTVAATFTRTVLSGSITCTIGSSTGVLSITAFSGTLAKVQIDATYNGVTKTIIVEIVLVPDAPPVTGSGGGSSASQSVSGSISSNSYSTVYAEFIVTAGSNGQVALSAPLTYYNHGGTVPYSERAKGKWQWRVIAGSYADVTTEITGDYAVGYDDDLFGDVHDAGSIAVSMTKTSLTNGTDYQFKLLLRTENASINLDSLTGTASGQGS